MNVAPWSTASSPCIKFATEWPEIMKLNELWFKGYYNLVNFVSTNLQILELLVTEIIHLFKYGKSYCISLKKINQEPLTLLTFNPLIPGYFHLSALFRNKCKKCSLWTIYKFKVFLHTHRNFNPSFDQFFDNFPWFGQLRCQCNYGNISQIFSIDFG